VDDVCGRVIGRAVGRAVVVPRSPFRGSDQMNTP